jgi:uncharacterized membrane protein (DUF485 family)
MYNVARPATGDPLEETSRMPVLFAGDHPGVPAPTTATQAPPSPSPPAGHDYDGIKHSREFTSLRRRLRAFVFPMSLVFFAWYLTYVLLAAYAHDFMSRKVFGQVNVAILLGLGQFASTALITCAYLWYANKYIDPRVAGLRARAGLDDEVSR